MRVLSITILLVCSVFVTSRGVCESSNEIKNVEIEIYGNVKDYSIEAYVNEGDGFKKVIEAERQLQGNPPKKFNKIVKVTSDDFKLRIITGRYSYEFDVETKPNLKCQFIKTDDEITFGLFPMEELESKHSPPPENEQERICVCFAQGFSGKHVQVYGESELLFDEKTELDMHFIKKVYFTTKSDPFTVKIIVNGRVFSGEFNPDKGCVLFFWQAEKQLIINQYLDEDSIPGLM